VSCEPEISVLLPVRDAGRHLRGAVFDVLAQRGVTLELIAVDDGSSDGSRRRLEEWAREDRRLRMIATSGVGAARALELARDAASAALVGQMEADDRCPPDRFARLRDALLARPDWHGIVSRASVFGFESPGMRRYVEWQNALLDPVAMERARFIEIPALHQTGLYRNEALQRAGGFVGASESGGWPLDIDFWMRWFERGLIAGKLARVLYRWRQHAAQSTRTSPRHRPAALRRCKAAYFARGPGRDRPVDLLSTGATLEGWRAALRDAGLHDVRALGWKPGTPLPPTRSEALRLFAYGTEPARARVRRQVADFDAARDWFAG
jgi:glycosyltransferase involved in cell wall biosynthesis